MSSLVFFTQFPNSSWNCWLSSSHSINFFHCLANSQVRVYYVEFNGSKKSTFMSVLQKNRNLKQLRLFRVDEPISKKKQQCLAWKNPLQIWIIPVDDWAIHKCFIWKQDYSIYIFLSQIGKQITCIKMFWKLDPWSYFHYWLRSQWKDSLIFFFSTPSFK